MSTANVASVAPKKRKTLLEGNNVFKRFWKTRFLFLLFIPALVFYIMFKYVPMWGIRMAFYKYEMYGGFDASEWVGLYQFKMMFEYDDFWPIVMNTLYLGLQNLVIYFPLSVLFALMLNEIRGMRFKKVTQTISYMPHFLSVVVVCSLIRTLLDPASGAITSILKWIMGVDSLTPLLKETWFRPIMLISHTWSSLGWSSIVFLAAISSVDPALYEAARLDGAGRWRQMTSITLPAIAPTVSTMLILQVGHILDSSTEKVLLLIEPSTKVVANTLGYWNFDLALLNGVKNYGMSTAIGLFANVVNMIMLLLANWGSKKLTDSGIF